MQGAIYRVVVNVRSDFGNPDVRLGQLDHALPGEGWSEGWHPGTPLDYVQSLALHSTGPQFETLSMDPLIHKVVELIPVGSEISAFATSSGGSYSHSAHKVHRNRTNEDGALVVNPRSDHPRWLLFQFQDQIF